jgi:hypothetical protein
MRLDESYQIKYACTDNLRRILKRSQDARSCLVNIIEVGRRVLDAPMGLVEWSIGCRSWVNWPFNIYFTLSYTFFECLRQVLVVPQDDLPWALRHEFEKKTTDILVEAFSHADSYTYDKVVLDLLRGEHGVSLPATHFARDFLERIQLRRFEPINISYSYRFFASLHVQEWFLNLNNSRRFLRRLFELSMPVAYDWNEWFRTLSFPSRQHVTIAIDLCRHVLFRPGLVLINSHNATQMLVTLVQRCRIFPHFALDFFLFVTRTLLFTHGANANGLASCKLPQHTWFTQGEQNQPLLILATATPLQQRRFRQQEFLDVRPLIDLLLLGGAQANLLIGESACAHRRSHFDYTALHGRADLLLEALDGRWPDISVRGGTCAARSYRVRRFAPCASPFPPFTPQVVLLAARAARENLGKSEQKTAACELKDTSYLVGVGGKKKASSRAGVRANARRRSCVACAFTPQVNIYRTFVPKTTRRQRGLPPCESLVEHATRLLSVICPSHHQTSSPSKRVQDRALRRILALDKQHREVWRPTVGEWLADQHAMAFPPEIACLVLDYVDGTRRAGDKPDTKDDTKANQAESYAFYETQHNKYVANPSLSSLRLHLPAKISSTTSLHRPVIVMGVPNKKNKHLYRHRQQSGTTTTTTTKHLSIPPKRARRNQHAAYR